jgi:hypothetical protein
MVGGLSKVDISNRWADVEGTEGGADRNKARRYLLYRKIRSHVTVPT